MATNNLKTVITTQPRQAKTLPNYTTPDANRIASLRSAANSVAGPKSSIDMGMSREAGGYSSVPAKPGIFSGANSEIRRSIDMGMNRSAGGYSDLPSKPAAGGNLPSLRSGITVPAVGNPAANNGGDKYSGTSSMDLINQMYDEGQRSQIDALNPKYQAMRDESAVQNQSNLRAVLESAANRGDRGGMARQDELNSRLAGESALNNLNMQQAQAESDIRSSTLTNRIKDILSQRQVDTQNDQWNQTFGYQKERDQVADTRYTDERDYSRGRDTIADERYTDERDYNRGRDLVADDQFKQGIDLQKMQIQDQQDQRAIDNAWNRVNTLGYVDDAASKVLGIKVGTKTEDARRWQLQYDDSKRGGGGGGGGGGSKPTPIPSPSPAPAATPDFTNYYKNQGAIYAKKQIDPYDTYTPAPTKTTPTNAQNNARAIYAKKQIEY
jgi:hypothetical protein